MDELKAVIREQREQLLAIASDNEKLSKKNEKGRQLATQSQTREAEMKKELEEMRQQLKLGQQNCDKLNEDLLASKK